MASQLEFNFDAPAPGDLEVARRKRSAREREQSRIRSNLYYAEHREEIQARAGWRTDTRRAQIDAIARDLGIQHRDVLRNIRHLHAPWLSPNCYLLWRWAAVENRRLRNIKRVGAAQRAAAIPAPDDPILEIARETGMSIKALRILGGRYGVPLHSLDAFTTWKASQIEGRKAMNKRVHRRNYYANREQRLLAAKEYIANMPPDERERFKARRLVIGKKYAFKKYHSDPLYRLIAILRSRIYTAVSRARTTKSAKTIRLIGCTWPQMKAHLEAQFEPGMSWENYGKKEGQWSIDHRIPFGPHYTQLHRADVQRMLSHWTNLRPMWHSENARKHDKITEEHQFPLLMD